MTRVITISASDSKLTDKVKNIYSKYKVTKVVFDGSELKFTVSSKS